MRVNGRMGKWMDMENYIIQMAKLHIKGIGLMMNLMVLGESTTKYKTNSQGVYL